MSHYRHDWQRAPVDQQIKGNRRIRGVRSESDDRALTALFLPHARSVEWKPAFSA